MHNIIKVKNNKNKKNKKNKKDININIDIDNNNNNNNDDKDNKENNELNHNPKDINLLLGGNSDHIKINYIKDLESKEKELKSKISKNSVFGNINKLNDLNLNKKKDKDKNKNKENFNESKKEIFRDKIPIRKMKYPFFVFLCKFIFYSFLLFLLYLLVKIILKYYGFIIIPENENKEEWKFNGNNNSINHNNYVNENEIPLKLNEMKDLKIT
jgi:hypothetical protein